MSGSPQIHFRSSSELTFASDSRPPITANTLGQQLPREPSKLAVRVTSSRLGRLSKSPIKADHFGTRQRKLRGTMSGPPSSCLGVNVGMGKGVVALTSAARLLFLLVLAADVPFQAVRAGQMPPGAIIWWDANEPCQPGTASPDASSAWVGYVLVGANATFPDLVPGMSSGSPFTAPYADVTHDHTGLAKGDICTPATTTAPLSVTCNNNINWNVHPMVEQAWENPFHLCTTFSVINPAGSGYGFTAMQVCVAQVPLIAEPNMVFHLAPPNTPQ